MAPCVSKVYSQASFGTLLLPLTFEMDWLLQYSVPTLVVVTVATSHGQRELSQRCLPLGERVKVERGQSRLYGYVTSLQLRWGRWPHYSTTMALLTPWALSIFPPPSSPFSSLCTFCLFPPCRCVYLSAGNKRRHTVRMRNVIPAITATLIALRECISDL
jgi:hypothetical protein